MNTFNDSRFLFLLIVVLVTSVIIVTPAMAAVPTPTFAQLYMMGGDDGGGYDVMDRRLWVYLDVTNPSTSACSGTGGSYDWAYADSFCNVPNETRYLTTQLQTLDYDCSTWTQWHTTSTSNGKLVAPYGRPLGKNYAVTADKHPAFIGRLDGATNGWSWYYIYGIQSLNGFQCEKSMCKTYFDCPNYEIETTTAGPNFWPLCSCSCLSGHAGQYCEVPLDCSGRGTLTGSGSTAQCTCNVAGTLGSGCQGMPTRTSTYANADGYDHEFTLYCEANPITYYTAKKRCDLADGTRFLATPRSGLSLPTVQTLAASDTAWVGLESYYSAADMIFYGGRYKNIVLASGYTSRNVSESVTVTGLAVREMNKALTCYICEQQTCSASLDCVEANTRSATGYYPICTCLCKSGSSGLRCQRTGTITLTLSIQTTLTNTAPKTASHPQTATPTQQQTLSGTLPHTGSNTLPLTRTHTNTAPITISDPPSKTTTNPLTLSGTLQHTSTPSLPTTRSLSRTVSYPHTNSHTLPMSSTQTHLPTSTWSSTLSSTEEATRSALELSQTLSMPSTHSRTSSISPPYTTTNTDTPTQSLSHDISPSPTLLTTQSYTPTSTEEATRSALSASHTASGLTYSNTPPKTTTPSLSRTSTQSVIPSRACPLVVSTIYRSKVSGSTDDLTLLADGLVRVDDVRQGLLVINLTMTNNASTATTFTFHSDVQRSNITAIDHTGALLNIAPACTLTTPSHMMCTVSSLPDYQVLDEQVIEIRGNGAGVSPPCVDSPWTVTRLSTAPAASTQQSGSSAAAVSTLAIAGILLFDGTPIEIQVLTALLNSACASDDDHGLVRIVRYFLSPAMHLGSLWVIVVNVGIAAGFAALHALVVVIVYAYRRHRASSDTMQEAGEPQKPVSPEGRAEIMAVTSSDLLFPGIPLIISHMLYIGVACATFDILRTGEGSEMGISVAGFVYVAAIPAIDLYLLRKVMVVAYHDYTDLGCEPRGLLATWFYPRGVWGPRRDVRRYFGLIGPYREGYRYLAVAPLALAVVAAIIFYAANDALTCRYTFAVASLLLIVIAFVKLFLAPRRARILSILTSICLFAVAGVSAINFFTDLLLNNAPTGTTDALKYMFLGIAIGTAILRTIITIIIFVGEIVWSRRTNANHDIIVTNGFVLDERSRSGGNSKDGPSGEDGEKLASSYSGRSGKHPGSSNQGHSYRGGGAGAKMGDNTPTEEPKGRRGALATSPQRPGRAFGGGESLLFMSVNELDIESGGTLSAGPSPMSLNGKKMFGDGSMAASRRRLGGTRNQSMSAASQSAEMMGLIKSQHERREHDIQAASAYRSRQSISFSLDEDGVWVEGRNKKKGKNGGEEWSYSSYRSGGGVESSQSMQSPDESTNTVPTILSLCAAAAAKHNAKNSPRRGGGGPGSSDSLQSPDNSGTSGFTSDRGAAPPSISALCAAAAKKHNNKQHSPNARGGTAPPPGHPDYENAFSSDEDKDYNPRHHHNPKQQQQPKRTHKADFWGDNNKKR